MKTCIIYYYTLLKYIVLLSEGLECLFYVPTRLKPNYNNALFCRRWVGIYNNMFVEKSRNERSVKGERVSEMEKQTREQRRLPFVL